MCRSQRPALNPDTGAGRLPPTETSQWGLPTMPEMPAFEMPDFQEALGCSCCGDPRGSKGASETAAAPPPQMRGVATFGPGRYAPSPNVAEPAPQEVCAPIHLEAGPEGVLAAVLA